MTALAVSTAPSRWWHSRAVLRFISHRLALLGLAMITLLTLACVLGPYLLPYDSLHIDLRARFAPPMTGNHYLGTDPLGRDLAARLLMAGRISLLVGFSAMLLSVVIGALVGEDALALERDLRKAEKKDQPLILEATIERDSDRFSVWVIVPPE